MYSLTLKLVMVSKWMEGYEALISVGKELVTEIPDINQKQKEDRKIAD